MGKAASATRREVSGVRPLPARRISKTEQERQRAEAEKQRADAATLKLQRLEAQVAEEEAEAQSHPGVIRQIRTAFQAQNRLAALVGAVLGGTVPVASFQLAHHEVNRAVPLVGQVPAWLVLGGLLFSAITVFGWTREAFGSPVKAAGFCLLIEGALLASQTPWLSFLALGVLVGVNVVATATRLSSRG